MGFVSPLLRVFISLNSVIRCTYGHLLSWSPFPALRRQGGYAVRALRAFLKSENQPPRSLHWIVVNFFHHRRRDDDEINPGGERTSLKTDTELWILDMDFDGLGPGFLWNMRGSAETNQETSPGQRSLQLRVPSSLANENFEKWKFWFH